MTKALEKQANRCQNCDQEMILGACIDCEDQLEADIHNHVLEFPLDEEDEDDS